MLVTTRRFAIALAAAAAAVGFPASARGADATKVIRVDPATGAQTVLAAGGPLRALTGIAAGPSGTVYVSDSGASGGIYSLTAPGFAVTPMATTVPITHAWDLAASASTVYALDSEAGVVGVDAAAPFAQKVLSPQQPDNETTELGNPDQLVLAGATLYGTYASYCSGPDSAGDSRPAGVLAIDTTTGVRSWVTSFDCIDPSAIAVAPDGTLLVAMPGVDRTPAKILRIKPGTEKDTVTTVSQGGALRNPSDIAVAPSGDLIVADRTSGVLRISPQTGKQSTVASGGDLNGVNAVAVDASGGIYAVAPGGLGAVLSVSVPERERYSAAGIRISAACAPRCTVGFSAKATCCTGGKGSVNRVGSKRSVRLKLPARTNRSIVKRLHRYRTAGVTLTLRAEDGQGNALGLPITVSLVLTR